MKLSNSDKKNILDTYKTIVARIADISYQTRVWIKGEGPECDDFDETVCQFFDISNPILDDYKNFNIPETQYSLLKSFSEEFKKFSEDNYLPQEFIESHEWKKIVQSAKEVIRSFL